MPRGWSNLGCRAAADPQGFDAGQYRKTEITGSSVCCTRLSVPPHPPLDPDQLATEFFETVVIEAEGELYPAIGDAALGDEAPEDLFQDPRKIHSFAPLAAAFVLVPGRSLPRA
jgi:hypothetical protein